MKKIARDVVGRVVGIMVFGLLVIGKAVFELHAREAYRIEERITGEGKKAERTDAIINKHLQIVAEGRKGNARTV